MSEFDLLSAAGNGMREQRALLDIAARNVAAAQASGPNHQYPRLVAGFQTALAAQGETDDADAGDPGDGSDGLADQTPAAPVLRAHTERGGADALTEMIAVLDAQRAYEQDASIFDLGKHLAERTLDVGRS